MKKKYQQWQWEAGQCTQGGADDYDYDYDHGDDDDDGYWSSSCGSVAHTNIYSTWSDRKIVWPTTVLVLVLLHGGQSYQYKIIQR